MEAVPGKRTGRVEQPGDSGRPLIRGVLPAQISRGRKNRKSIAGIFLIATPFWGGAGWRYEGFQRVVLPADFGAKLPSNAPVFLYHGCDDETVPFAHLDLYAEKLPHATRRGLEGRGHQLSNDLSEVAADIRNVSAVLYGSSGSGNQPFSAENHIRLLGNKLFM
jgi:hypothetical protein